VIAVLLRAMTPRLAVLALAMVLFYLYEPAFHTHEVQDLDPQYLGVEGLAATLANLTGVAMLVLLAGFVSTDRRRGYYRMFFCHPTRPLAFYALHWVLALVLAMASAAVFLVAGQLAAWGEFRGGWSGLFLALLSAVVYGGVMAFLSAVLRSGEAWVSVVIFLFTFFWLSQQIGGDAVPDALRDLLTMVLPPQLPLGSVYMGLLAGVVDWGAALFALGYGVFWLAAAALVLRLRDWP
jgi:ABC-type transport system involved in multi-copper enzyme maturation permease subunit